MSDLTIASSSLTMSSREIAELTGKRHDHVMRDIRAMLVELHGEGDVPKFGDVYLGGNGEERPCFNLPKRESLILVSGYNVQMRAAIIDRWQELEDAVAIPAADVRELQAPSKPATRAICGSSSRAGRSFQTGSRDGLRNTALLRMRISRLINLSTVAPQ